MKEQIIDIVMVISVIAIFLYGGWIVVEVQQHQIGEMLTRGCNETTINEGCYTTDTDNYMIYCKNTFNLTLNNNVSTCERVALV